MPQLSIVIPALDALELLEATLVSVLQNRPDDCEIVVVLDRAYEDPYELQDEVRFVVLPQARTLVAALRSALPLCRALLVHLLAPGVEVEEGWTEPVLRHFYDNRVAAVAPLVLRSREDEVVCACGLDYGAGGVRRRRACGTALENLQSGGDVLGPTLMAGFYRTDVLRALPAPFDDRVTAELLDVDVALQIRAAGYRAVVEPRSFAYRAGAELPKATPFAEARGAERLFWRNAPAVGWFRSLALHLPAVLAGALKHRSFGAVTTSVLGRLIACLEIVGYRRHHQSLAALGTPGLAYTTTSTGDNIRIDAAHPRSATAAKSARADAKNSALRLSRPKFADCAMLCASTMMVPIYASALLDGARFHASVSLCAFPARAISTALALTLLCGGASSSNAAEPQTRGPAIDGMFSSRFGIGGCHVRNRSATDNAAWIPQMAAVGLNVIRSPQAGWGAVEPEEGRWAWDELDRQIQYLDEQGFEYGILLHGNAKWNTLDERGTLPVNNLAAWSNYAGQVAAHVKGRAKHFEIWNEPPNGTGRDQTPADYAKIVVAAHDAVKKAQPEALVGLAAKSVHVNYLEQVIQAGARDHFDFIVLHPYEVLNGVANNTGSEAVFLNIVPTVRKMLAAQNPSKQNVPIIFTELGSDAGKGLDHQAHALVKAYVMSIAQGVASVQWFEGRDGDSGPMGLIEAKGKPRPSYTAMQQTLRHFGHAPQYLGWVLLNDRHYGFVFRGAETTILCTWARPGAPDVVDFRGDVRIVNPTTGNIVTARSYELGVAPVIVLDVPQMFVDSCKRICRRRSRGTATTRPLSRCRLNSAKRRSSAACIRSPVPTWPRPSWHTAVRRGPATCPAEICSWSIRIF
ncbi:MAG: cellulase family glycosylhydrolase [Pirellulales bacterium]